MKIAVCAKVAPDTATPRITAKGDGSGIDTTGIKFVVSPYDLFAVTEGIVLKEQGKASAVHLFTVGGDSDVTVLRGGALALGAEDLTLVDDPALAEADSLAVARSLAAAIGQGEFGLVLCGKQAVDHDNVQVPAMLAELLGWPHVSLVDDLVIDGDGFTATRNVGGGVAEVVKGTLPAVVTCDKGLVEPRYAKLPDIMKAKQKKVHKKTLGDLGLSAADVAPAATYTAYGEPPPRPKGRMLEGDVAGMVDQLVDALRNEAKVL
ncbi:MAG: electron transfer flavoprotein subunit beta/FixA family protein [Alphaproteobacteria bacterium]|nr:electron transfer flavoprotein subunit beta/FixA family protein [Alphaproteobacteria bacterium]